MPVEQIKHAAVKWQDGEITTGRDHGQAFQKREGWRDENTPTCGFITSSGRFVDRREANDVATHAGQLTIEKGDYKQLFSEELWYWPKNPYKYDDEKGYHK